MASLNHVCMWSDDGWKKVTAEQAAILHPGGTVSAHSGLFMCELCGQYVLLTDSEVNVRHFRHSSDEQSKNCPERTFGSKSSVSYEASEHDLPIRIHVSNSSFKFEMGFVRVPENYLNNNLRIEIKPMDTYDAPFIFAAERFYHDRITYLPIGEKPFKKYKLTIKNGNDKLHDFWPIYVSGISPTGTLFNKNSGQKLSYDSDVECNKEYYLLKCWPISKEYDNSVQIQQILRKTIDMRTWYLYSVIATDFNESVAKFYLDFHCRLTDNPVTLQPIWPLYVESNYIIKHNNRLTYILVNGEAATFNTFPKANLSCFSNNLREISCSGRQQLISAGRMQALQYTYFWREPLIQIGTPPNISVTDLTGCKISSGKINALPPKRTLIFLSEYDGEIIVSMRNTIIDKRKLPAHKNVELDKLTYDMNVKVSIGLDIIWQIDLIEQSSTPLDDEDILLERITHIPEATITTPHSLKNMLISFDCYPKLVKWMRNCIGSGFINEQSYRLLQEFYIRIKTKGETL